MYTVTLTYMWTYFIKVKTVSKTDTPPATNFVCNERKSEQAHKPQAATLLEKAVYNEWLIPSISDRQSDRKQVSSELHKIILAQVQKGCKLLLINFL